MGGNSRGSRMAAMAQEDHARQQAKQRKQQQQDRQPSCSSSPNWLPSSTPKRRRSTESERKPPPLSKRAKILMGDMDPSDNEFQSPHHAGHEMKRRMATDADTTTRRQQMSTTTRPQTLTGIFRRSMTRAFGQLGMQNLGNTCYMNAVAQVLSGLQSFVCDLQRLPPPVITNNSMVAALQQLVQQRSSAARLRAGRAISLAAVKAAMERSSDFTRHGVQQDAHEFFCLLLQQLQEEVLEQEWLQKKAEAPPESADADQELQRSVKLTETCCPVARNFEFTLAQRLTCTSCGHRTEMLQGFNHLSLELPAVEETAIDVAALLGQYMSHGEVSKSCEECRGVCTPHMLSHEVSRLPQILVLHIKRFQVAQPMSGGPAELQKVHTRVKQAPSLSLSAWSTRQTMLPVGQTENPGALHQVVACAVADKENLHRGTPAGVSVAPTLSGAQLSSLLQGTKGVSCWPVTSQNATAQTNKSPRTSLGRSHSYVSLDDFDLQRAIQESKTRHDPPLLQEDLDIQQALLASMANAPELTTVDLSTEEDEVRLDLSHRLREAQASKCASPGYVRKRPVTVIDEEVQAAWQPESASGTDSEDRLAACPGQLLHRYVLRGCISHIGQTPSQGHFVADVATSRGWTRFDDSQVTQLSNSPDILPPSEARERDSYLMFYDLQYMPNGK